MMTRAAEDDAMSNHERSEHLDSGESTDMAASPSSPESSEPEGGLQMYEWAETKIGPAGLHTHIHSSLFKKVSYQHWKSVGKDRPIRLNISGKEGSSYGYARNTPWVRRNSMEEALFVPTSRSARVPLPTVCVRAFAPVLYVKFCFTPHEDGNHALVQYRHAFTDGSLRACVVDVYERVTVRQALEQLRRQLVSADHLSPQTWVKTWQDRLKSHSLMPWVRRRPRQSKAARGKGRGKSKGNSKCIGMGKGQ